MKRSGSLILVALLTASCDRSDYVIDLKRTHIERVDRVGGSGYVVVDKRSADTMAKYGDVYVYGRMCRDGSCKPLFMGILDKYDQVPAEGGARLNIAVLSEAEGASDYPSFWMKSISCLKLEALKGVMGRTGRSKWNCSVTSSAPK